MKRVRKTEPQQQPQHKQMLGVGLDNTDGEKRLTRGENFTLVGGSDETHSMMQETAIKVNETFNRRGKTLDEAYPEEFRDVLYDVVDRIRR